MKILTLSKLLTYSTSPDEIQNIHTLLIINKGYQSIEDFTISLLETSKKSNNPLFINTYQLYLSYNYLTEKDLSTIWNSFPSIWWLTISFNQIKSISTISFPLALGLLDLIGNDQIIQQPLALIHLASIHLLRLNIEINEEYILENHNLNNVNTYIASVLPNVWVINDDFITNIERSTTIVIHNNNTNTYFTSNITTANVSIVADTLSAEQWSNLQNNHLNIRSKNLLRMIQDCPYDVNKVDEFKLDILLEDYYHQVCYYNTYVESITTMNNGTQSFRNIPFMPVFDIKMIYFLPHRLQLDLSVVLTTSILFTIPKNLLKDALIILLMQYIPINEIEHLMLLPRYIKTALVSLLRRIVKKEKVELDTTGTMALRDSILRKDYSSLKQKQQSYIIQYLSNSSNNLIMDNGFYYYLRIIKEYLNTNQNQNQIATKSIASQQQQYQQFTEIEIEILTKLPDVPNYASYQQQLQQLGSVGVNYPEWVSFAARHTVLLLTKSPSCPPLTKTQTSKAKQDLYIDLLPILKAASLTLSDLDIQALGPSYDGRILMKTSTISGISRRSSTITDKYKSNSNKELTTLSSSIDFLGAYTLPFGAGIPYASPVTSLSWKVHEETVPRNYNMPWQVNHNKQEEVGEEKGGIDNIDNSIFLTATYNHNNSNNTTNSGNHQYISKHVVELNSCYAIHEYMNLNSNSMIVNPLEVDALAPLSRGNSRNTTRDRQPIPNNNTTNTNDTMMNTSSINASETLTLLSRPYQDNIYNNTDEIPPDYKKQYIQSLPSTPKYNPSKNNNYYYTNNNNNNNNNTATNFNNINNTRINHSLHQVSGFSADACWNNRFLLAPPRAINQVTAATTTAATTTAIAYINNKQYHTYYHSNQWDAIELAPVVIHSSATRIPFETVLKVFANNETTTNHNNINNNHNNNTTTMMKTNKQLDDSGTIVNSSISESIVFDDDSTHKYNASIVNNENIKYIPNDLKKIDAKDLELQLLREMGTIRNVNKLNKSNKKLISVINGTNQSKHKVDKEMFDDESISHLQDMSIYDTNSIKSDTFLTNINDIDDHIVNHLEPSRTNSDMQPIFSSHSVISTTTFDEFIDNNNYSPNINQNNNDNNNSNIVLRKSISISKHIHEPPLKELMNSISTLDILKSKQRYSRIYTNNQTIESGDIGVNGVVLTPTWYPLLDKKLYQLANQSLDQNKVLVKPSRLIKHDDDKIIKKSIQKEQKEILKHSIKNTLLDNATLEIISDHMNKDNSKPSLLYNGDKDSKLKIELKDNDNKKLEALNVKHNSMNDNQKELDENLINNKYFRSIIKPPKKKNSRIIPSNIKNLTSNKLSFTSKHQSLHYKDMISDDCMIYSNNSSSSSNINNDIDINKKHFDSIVTNQTSETLYIITPQLIYRQPPAPSTTIATTSSELIISSSNEYPNIQLSIPQINITNTTTISGNDIKKDLKNDLKVRVPKSLLLSGVSLKGNVMQFTDHLEENTITHSINSKSDASLSINSATQGLKDILGSYQSSIRENSADCWDLMSEATFHIEESNIKNHTIAIPSKKQNSSTYEIQQCHTTATTNNPFLLRLQPELEIDHHINTKKISTSTTNNNTMIKKKEPTFYNTIMDREHFNKTKPYSYRFPGQSEHPWIGQNQYKAATHKIQLNRNFKYTLPPLDKINDDI